MPGGVVAIARCDNFVVRDPDMPLLLDALERTGIDARSAAWDDPEERWDEYSLVVVRSTWDYVSRLEEFLAWAASVPRLANPADLLSWNTDKRYLRALEDAGLPVVATRWVPVGEMAEFPAGDFVVKPTVGNGTRDAGRFASGEEELATALVATIHGSGRCAMVQPYLASLEAEGETGLCIIGGEYSHAIRKSARLTESGGRPSRLIGLDGVRPHVASAAQRRLASDVLDAVPGGADRLCYARVDVAAGADGEPVLMELEITEPSLFLGFDDGAPARLAGAIAELVSAGT